MHDDDFDDFDDQDISTIDWDDIPDILHRWLEQESGEQQAFLHGEDYDEALTDVLDFKEVVFLILYLCSMFEIGAQLSFPDGGGITLDPVDEE